jgi:folate-dependent phosphoribosylglycinamide formyltransferase PurN
VTVPVVLLAAPGASTDVLANALWDRWPDLVLVLEQPVSRITLLRRRVRRLGVKVVLGQVLFLLLVVPALDRLGRQRVAELREQQGLDVRPWTGPTIHVSSVNADEAREVLAQLGPQVVVVGGTRIIAGATLESVAAPFLNVHAGVTPQYRGVHGGYWALADGRPDLAGATLHVVDTGIDTGPILAQPLISAGPSDSFVTYPSLQLAAALPHLLTAVTSLLEGRELRAVEPRDPGGPSVLRSHPTAWGYLGRRWRRGVR